MFSSIIRRTCLYLQYLIVFTQVVAGWYLGCAETENRVFSFNASKTPAGNNLGEYYQIL
jgi:hypothetical protein